MRYVAWHGLRGTVSADSLQPYLSAINRIYQDHTLQPVALGPLVNEAVNGLRGLQQPLHGEETRVYLPAQAALDIFQAVEALLSGLAAAKTVTVQQVSLARDMLATVVAFQWFNRAGTNHTLLETQLKVDGPRVADPQIRLFPKLRKGKKRVRHQDIPEVLVPVSCQPRLAKMISQFKTVRSKIFRKSSSVASAKLWALPGDKPSQWTSQVQTTWLQNSMKFVGITAPQGCKYTSHSLRKGAATAAYVIQVPLEIICFFGHWAVASKTVKEKYIDPSSRPSAAATFFFGWMLKPS